MLEETTITRCRIWTGDAFEEGKLCLEGAHITEAGAFSGIRGHEVDGHGLAVLPALVDNHVHFREPGAEEKEDFRSGSAAAAHGGVGYVLEVQNCPPLLNSPELAEAKRRIVMEKSRVKVGLYASAVPKVLSCFKEMTELTAGLKLFMAPSHGDDGVDGEEMMRPYFHEAARHNFLLIVHAEDGGIVAKASRKYGHKGPAFFSKARPPRAEIAAVEVALKLAGEYGTRLHIFHLTTAGAADLVKEARDRGLEVSASTCPHYLFFTEEDLPEKGGLLKVNPSIKAAHDRDRLLQGIREDEIEIVSTDHAPHTPQQKSLPFEKVPAGISSADLLLPLMTTLVGRGELDFSDLVRLLITNPVRIHGLIRGTRVKPGDTADLVFFDPDAEWVVQQEDLLSRASLSPYVGMKLTGKVAATLVEGKAAYLDAHGPLGDALS